MEEINTGFVDDWDDIDVSDAVDTGDTEQEEPQTETDPVEAGEPERTQEPEVQPEADQSFQLKYMGELRDVSREEVVTLAQKGMDYDRIKGRLESLTAEQEKYSDTVGYLNELAAAQNISLEQLVDNTRAAVMMRDKGITMDEAMKQIAYDKRERDLQKREAKLNAQDSQALAQQKDAERRQTDIRQFITRFPGVDPKTIPKDVWAEVSRGTSLTEAYATYENAQLKQKLEAALKNRENKERTTGSRSTAGNKGKEDPFDKLWYEDD